MQEKRRQKALAQEEKRRKRQQERERRKEAKMEARRQRERDKLAKERAVKEEREAKLEAERMRIEAEEAEKAELKAELERQQREQERQEMEASASTTAESSGKRKKKKKKDRKKRKIKGAAPPLDTSIAALDESAEQEVIRQSPSASSSRRHGHGHQKKQTREEEVMADLVSLLDIGDEDDSYDDEIDSVSKRGSDNESVISDAVSLSNIFNPKTPRRKRNSVSSNNSAMNTPTFSSGKSHFGGQSGFDTPQMTPVPGISKHVSGFSWGSELGSVADGVTGMPDGMPMINDNMSTFGYSEMGDDEEERAMTRKKVCGVSMREITALDLNEVYAQRSPILFDEEMLSKKFSKKMGKEFCLNAAATKLIFVAGLQVQFVILCEV